MPRPRLVAGGRSRLARKGMLLQMDQLSRRNLLVLSVLLLGCSLPICAQGSAAAPGFGRPAQAADALPDFTTLVEQESAAVVNISTTRTVREEASSLPDLPENDSLRQFFRRFAPPQGLKQFQTRSLGSGFIISQDGYILTNAHVVDQAKEVTVKLQDKRELKGRVIGVDRRTDVALVKIAARGLAKVNIGDSNRLKVGEWVVAIGSSFGFENSVTKGIVSAKGRTLPDETYVPFIQTDAAVNPGNSGGPLFNMKGEVVGITSQIYSRSGGFMGISFAIPIDVAMNVADQLRAHGKVTRGRLGVVIQEVTPELAHSFGLSGSPSGALVASVERDSPAGKAGVLPGDIIVKYNGKPIQSSTDLPRMVASTKPGSRVDVEIWRKGGSKSVAIVVGELAAETGGRAGR
jgi:serine protease Do